MLYTGFVQSSAKYKELQSLPLSMSIKDIAVKIMETQNFEEHSDFKTYNVELAKTGGYIHTIEAGMENKQVVVLIHGYGASSVFWFKVIPYLSQYFRVLSIDLYGMGQSSRPDFGLKTFEEAVDFFCGAIEEWREKLGLEDFILMGHSFGGYTASRYVMTRKPPVKKLYLLSPAGFTLRELKGIKKVMKERHNTPGFVVSILQKLVDIYDNMWFTPFQLMNISGRQRALIATNRQERFRLKEDEIRLLSEYYYRVTELRTCGDKALPIFLTAAGAYSKRPLCDDLFRVKDELPDVHVMYGEVDWMDRDHSKEKIEELGLGFEFTVIPDSGHQVIFQQPAEIARIITEGEGIEFNDLI